MKRAFFIAGLVLGIVIGLIGAIGITTWAQTEVELEVGQCRFSTERDGIFWQHGRYTRNYMTPTCASIGVAGRLPTLWIGARPFGGAFGYRVALLVSGDVQNRDNVATYRDDEAENFRATACDYSGGGHGCMTTHNGSGAMKGVAASLTWSRPIAGRLSIGAEGGVLFYRLDYLNRATWAQGECNGCPPPGDFEHRERRDLVTALPGLVAGARVRYGNLYLAARHVMAEGHRAISLTDGAFTQLMVGVAIPLGGKS